MVDFYEGTEGKKGSQIYPCYHSMGDLETQECHQTWQVSTRGQVDSKVQQDLTDGDEIKLPSIDIHT